MFAKNPYLQSGLFLALLFTAVAFVFGPRLRDGRAGRHHHDHHRIDHRHDHHRADVGERQQPTATLPRISHTADRPRVSMKARAAGSGEEIPTWPTCDNTDYEERLQCTIEEYVYFLGNHVQPMPGHQGIVIGLFDVTEGGQMINSELHEGDDPALTAETMRLVGLLQGAGFKWRPGKIDGKVRQTKMFIAVGYNLECGDCERGSVSFKIYAE